jgi:hypothetical protein
MGSSRNMTKFSISNLPSLNQGSNPSNPPKYRIVREKNSTGNDFTNNSSTTKINTREINPSDMVFSNKKKDVVSPKHINGNPSMSKTLVLKETSDSKLKPSLKNESTRVALESSSGDILIKWDLTPGDRWDVIEQNLVFGQCIGEGSFARVYDGFDKVIGKPVAIKVIKKKMFTTEKKRYLVQVEIDILSKMVHGNIVKFERLLEDHKRVKQHKF